MTTPPRWHDLDLHVVTPAYLGRFATKKPNGYKEEIPFPVSSLRGVLAYWLRALAGPYVGASAKRLLDVEIALFGAATEGDVPTPSSILLRAGRVCVRPVDEKRSPGVGYLMGPGLTDDGKLSPRQLEPGPVLVRVKNLRTPQHATLFLAALWALCSFGGIGARSRRGFGTLHLAAVPDLPVSARFDPAWFLASPLDVLPQVLAAVGVELRELGISPGPAFPGPPGYPSLDRIQVAEHPLRDARNTIGALDRTGLLLRAFRHSRSPQPGFTPNPKQRYALPNTAGFRDVAQPARRGAATRGRFIDGTLGLPVAYTERGYGDGVLVEPLVDGKPARRASPLWLRATKSEGSWSLRSLAFYSEWLPPDVLLQARAPGHIASVKRPKEEETAAELRRWFTEVKRELSAPEL